MEIQEKIRLSWWAGLTAGFLLISALIVAVFNGSEQTGIKCVSTQQNAGTIEDATGNCPTYPEEENKILSPKSDQQNSETSRERNYTSPNKRFILPVEGRLTSKFGYRKHPMGGGKSFHPGIDIAAPLGTPVRAACGGKVIFAGWLKLGGGTIFLRHSDGFETRYLHLSKIEVKRGQRVTQGQIIGKVGSTGRSTGPHLHFEIRKRGIPLGPLKFLDYSDAR